VQTKLNRVMRVLPLENEAINECWLSDKDRYSYEALDSDARLTRPMVKQDGRWHETDWETALDAVSAGLKEAGADLGVLATPHTTLEELYLVQRLAGGVCASRTSRPTARAACPGSACRWPISARSTACSSSARSCARTIR